MKAASENARKSALSNDIIKDANRCVLCGLCSASCPTYRVAKDENESPRGRIAMMQGVARQQLAVSPELEKHIDQCLGCRTCEAVCPSQVNYGRLLARGKALIRLKKQNNWLGASLYRAGLNAITRSKFIIFLLGKLLWLYQSTGLRALITNSRALKISRLARWDAYLPNVGLHTRWDEYYPAHVSEKGQVALFTGCFTNTLDRATFAAGIRILNRYGYGVHVPREQSCCGALLLNNGFIDDAKKCMHTNLRTFQIQKVNAILYGSTGCGASLRDYDRWLSPSENPAVDATQLRRFVARSQDITEFLAAIPNLAHLTVQPFYKTIAIHTPCLSRNVLKTADASARLLRFIPGAKLAAISDQISCCGAGGSHLLTHPAFTETLGLSTIDEIKRIKPDVVVTTNLGCAMQLKASLKAANLDIPVKHPVVLFDEQLP